MPLLAPVINICFMPSKLAGKPYFGSNCFAHHNVFALAQFRKYFLLIFVIDCIALLVDGILLILEAFLWLNRETREMDLPHINYAHLLLALYVICIIAGIGMLVFLLDILLNKSLDGQTKLMWCIAMVLMPIGSMPAYWWFAVRKTPKNQPDPFD